MVTPELVKIEGNLSDVPDEIIIPNIKKAQYRVERELGARYFDISTDGTASEKEMLDLAIANYAISYIIPTISIKTQGNGIVTSVGWDSARQELLSPERAEELSKHYAKVAKELLDKLRGLGINKLFAI